MEATEYQLDNNAEELLLLRLKIAELEQANAQLKLEKTKLETENRVECQAQYTLFNATPAAICILNGANHVFEFANPLFLQITNGLDLLGKPIREALPEPAWEPLYQLLDKVYETGVPFTAYETPVPKTRKTDENLWETGYFNYTFQVYNTEAGATNILVLAYDVTEHVLTRKELEKSIQAQKLQSERLKLAQQTASIGVFESYMPEDRISWTPELEALYGLLPGQFGGNYAAWAKMVHPDDLEKASGKPQIDKGGSEYNTEFRVIWPDKSIHWLMARAKIYYDENMNAVSVLGVNIDITERKQIESVLQQSQELLQNIIDNSDTNIYVKDIEGHYLLINRRIEERYHLSKEQVLGKTDAEIFPQTPLEQRTEWRENDDLVILAQTPVQSEEIIVEDDGVRTYLSTKFPLRNNDGVVYAVCGMSTDITDRKNIEKTLRHSEQAFRDLADAIPQIVFTANELDKSYYYNKRWFEFTGLHPVSSYPESWLEKIHPDDVAGINKAWEKATREKAVFIAQYRLLGTNGVYRWHLGRATPIVDSEGNITKWYGTATDIDDNKRSLDRMHLLSEISTILVSSLDYEETLHKVVNRAILYFGGHCLVDLFDENDPTTFQRIAIANADPQKEAIAREIDHSFPPDWNGPHPMAQATKSGKTFIVTQFTDEDLIAQAHNDEHLQLLRYLNPKSAISIPFKVRNRIIGLFSCVSADSERAFDEEDITLAQIIAQRLAMAIDNSRLYHESRKSLETQKELDYFKDLFMSVASHELRSPLTSIKGYAQLLQHSLLNQIKKAPEAQERRQGQTRLVRSLDNIVYQVNRMNDLVNQLLNFSRIQSRQLELQYTVNLNLNELLQRVIEQHGLTHKEHIIKAQLPDQPLLGTWDAGQLEQVLDNLINNSIKYSPNGTTIIVGLEINSNPEILGTNQAIIWVRDEGYGISKEDQETIFDRFYRIRNRQNAKVEGLGLGLYVSNEIIKQHGGKMWVESEPGKGSTFYLSLPLEITTAS